MALDQKLAAAAKISAAASTNALAALRLAVEEALEANLSKEEIGEILEIAYDIQAQPMSHTKHLAHQLLRENKKPQVQHTHSKTCGCNGHS